MAAKKREQPPWVQLKAWERSAAGTDPLARLWLCRGDEPFFVRRAHAALAEGAKRRDAELSVHDGADPDFQLSVLLGDLATPSMFAARQVFVVRSVDGALRKSGKNQPPLVAAIESFLQRDDPDRALCLFAGTLRADHRVAKLAAESGAPNLNSRRLWDSPPPWKPDPMQAELVQWLLVHAKDRKIPLRPEDALELTRRVGNDPGGLDDELSALARGGGGGRPAFRAAGSPFAVADALLSGATAKALVGIEGLYKGGMSGRDGERVLDPGAIGALLVRSVAGGVRMSLTAASALRSGLAPDEAAALAGASGARAKPALLERLRSAPEPELWARRLEQVAALERRLKSAGGLGPGDWSQLALSWAVDLRRRRAAGGGARGRGRESAPARR